MVIIDSRFDLGDPAAGQTLWRDSHIPGAVFLDLEADLSVPPGDGTGRHPLPDINDLLTSFRRCGINDDSRVVVYDAWHGGIAARAWWLLTTLGHQHVALLERGVQGWLQDGYPMENGNSKNRQDGSFCASPERLRAAVVETAEVTEWLESSQDWRLIDARERERYLGENEPIDALAGRVPGALNLPFLELMKPDGRFLSRPVLRQKFSLVLDENTEQPWVAMCGSGVTACHLALAAGHAGVARPRIYIGSFSEWICNPDRPVKSG